MKIPHIEILVDESYRDTQAKELVRSILKTFDLKYLVDFKFSDGRLKEVLYLKDVEVDYSKHVLVSCGLETVQEAVRKKMQKPDIYSIAVQDPGKHHDKYDLIIIPEHEYPPAGVEHIVRCKGVINYVHPDFLQLIEDNPQCMATHKKLEDMPGPRVAMMIGGLHNGGDVDVEDAKFLGKKASELVNASNGSLMVSTSRRTEIQTRDALKEAITVPHHFYDYNYDGQDDNPYYSMLGLADVIIVTADSIRMCSEACSVGHTAVYIYHPQKLFFAYDEFCNNLVRDGQARQLDMETTGAGLQFETKHLDEANRLASIILEKIG